MKNFIRFLTLFIFLLPVCAANAQQTIFNAPSSDVLDKGKVYVELDASFKTNNDEALKKFSSFVPRAVVGAGGQFAFEQFEQTVNKYLNINADWLTGKTAAGYFTRGVAFKPQPRVKAYIGYSIGNAGANKGNHFSCLRLAATLTKETKKLCRI